MSVKNKVLYETRAKSSTLKTNRFPSEEVYESGPFTYRHIWNWAQLPKEIIGYQIPGLACDSDGYVYATVRKDGYPIAVFAPDGEFVKYLGRNVEVIEPHGIFVDSKRDVWITDAWGHVARKFNQDGELIQTLGSFKCPSDTGVNEVPGTRLVFYTERRLAGPFNRPTRIVEASNGHLYAADGYQNAAIHEFSPSGKLINTFGGMGDEPGKFGIVHSLCIDGRQRIWVADREFDRVQVFSLKGEWITMIDNLMYPSDVVADDEYIYIAEREGRVSIYDYEFNLVAQIGYWVSPFISHSIAVDHKTNLFLGLIVDDYNIVKLERIYSK